MHVLYLAAQGLRYIRYRLQATSRLYAHCSSAVWVWTLGDSGTCHRCNLHRSKDTVMLYK
jgi:hypothetical protein